MLFQLNSKWFWIRSSLNLLLLIVRCITNHQNISCGTQCEWGHWQPFFKTIKSSVGCLFEGIWLCLEQIIKWIVYLCSITLINYLFHHLLSLIIKVIIKSLEITLRRDFYRFFDTLIFTILHPKTSISSNVFVKEIPFYVQNLIKSNE